MSPSSIMLPHATTGPERRRSSSQHPDPDPVRFKFPDLSLEQLPVFDEREYEDIPGPSPGPLPNGLPNGLHSSERWPARKTSRGNWSTWANGSAKATRHGRQKSLSEAIKTVRTRKASISENAHEIAESLKAPVSFNLVVCMGLEICMSTDRR